jgi:broad specificity phosphatase PhoE
MTSIYLFRHAHTSFPKELVGGRSNQVPITERGELQAHCLGLWIATNNLKPDFIAVSPAIRTRETARIALYAAGITNQIHIEHRLQELTKGDAEGQPRTAIDTPELLARRAVEADDFRHTNGESNNDAATRLGNWVDEVTDSHQGELVFGFTHGIVTRCLVSKYLGWSFEEWGASVLDNTAATLLQFEDGVLQNLQFNISTQDQAGLEPK